MDATDVNPWGKSPKKVKNNTKSNKLSKNVSQKFEKTKVVATSGAKKIKAGASAGVNWLKIKYHAHKLAKKK
ncbi:hypothetical protein CTI12_AA090460 [Artemisia annua]|uniref:Uncharacterized protein n=1 Tax=Artemisia annua TaxID=35608 RepID=A0A2U1PZR1_ARTAN|nr:hypothetical protein CTI12_AA090460 [Artemisia annua]